MYAATEWHRYGDLQHNNIIRRTNLYLAGSKPLFKLHNVEMWGCIPYYKCSAKFDRENFLTKMTNNQ